MWPLSPARAGCGRIRVPSVPQPRLGVRDPGGRRPLWSLQDAPGCGAAAVPSARGAGWQATGCATLLISRSRRSLPAYLAGGVCTSACDCWLTPPRAVVLRTQSDLRRSQRRYSRTMTSDGRGGVPSPRCCKPQCCKGRRMGALSACAVRRARCVTTRWHSCCTKAIAMPLLELVPDWATNHYLYFIIITILLESRAGGLTIGLIPDIRGSFIQATVYSTPGPTQRSLWLLLPPPAGAAGSDPPQSGRRTFAARSPCPWRPAPSRR
jgi:hypothetical protein